MWWEGVHNNNFCTCHVINYHMNQFLLFKLRTHTYLRTSILVWNITSNTPPLFVYLWGLLELPKSVIQIYFLLILRFLFLFFCVIYVLWSSYCQISHCIQAPEASSTERSLAKICVADIGNFGERSWALALLNSPLLNELNRNIFFFFSKLRGKAGEFLC